MNLSLSLGCLCVFSFFQACNGGADIVTKTEKVHDYYLEHLRDTDAKIKELDSAVRNKASLSRLHELFREARLHYKQIEFLIEYINPELAKVINGAPVPEVEEEDNANTIQPPEGFQVIESLLYPEYNCSDSTRLIELTNELIKSLKQTISITETKQFTDSTIFKALRKELFRSSVLGLAGYDSPLSGYAIQETAEVWLSFGDIATIYSDRFDKADPAAYRRMKNLVDSGVAYLQHNPNFDSFDRLHFFTTYVNPMGITLMHLLKQAGIEINGSKEPVNTSIGSLFDKNAFSFDFYISDEEEYPSEEKELLGRYLFFDPALSGNGKRSCATCHQPGKAFTDGFAKSPAINGKSLIKRNTITLLNSAIQPALFYDARVTYLEDQISDVLSNPNEMHGSIAKTMSIIRRSRIYTALFKKAFPRSEEALTPYHLQNVIATYIRSLSSFNSPFDKYMRGDRSQLNGEEISGFNLFMGKAKCGTCHFAPLFNGSLPPDFVKAEVEVLGVPKYPGSRKVDEDRGRYNLYPAAPYLYAFRTPTVRNIALTAPYMHNGIYHTLKEVLDFYNDGGGIGQGIALVNQTLPSERLNLTEGEKRSIISFLKKLTDTAVAHKLPIALPPLDSEQSIFRKVNLYN